MSCQQIADLLDKHGASSLPPDARERATEHIFRCEDCGSAWRSIQMLQFLRDQPTPEARSGLFEKAMQLAEDRNPAGLVLRKRYTWMRGVPAALAASVLIVGVLTMMPATDRGSALNANGLTIALNETRDVSVAIDSKEALEGVEIHVLLSGGIALEGFAGRSAISWTTDLEAGVNKLTLPVSAIAGESGQVLVEVEHQGKRREFLVEINGDGLGGISG